MIGYICTDNRNIKDDIKYEVGKRYKIKTEENFIFYERSINDFKDILICDKIYKIKVYDSSDNDGTRNYKILCEINYKNLLNSENKNEQIMSAIKNKEESILKKLIQSDKCNDIMAVIKSGVHKYLDKIAESENKFMIAFLIKLKGRNKDIEKFIKNKDNDILSAIIKIGRHCDLDFFMKNSDDPYLKTQVLKHGRKRDIELYLNDINEPLFQNIIVLTGIDKYMDYIIENNFNYFSKVYLLDIGRKKDLDMFVNIEERNFSLEIIDKQYDDHLRLLRHNKNIAVSTKAKKIIDECELN